MSCLHHKLYLARAIVVRTATHARTRYIRNALPTNDGGFCHSVEVEHRDFGVLAADGLFSPPPPPPFPCCRYPLPRQHLHFIIPKRPPKTFPLMQPTAV